MKPLRQPDVEGNPEAGFLLLAVVVLAALILIALAVAAPDVAKEIRRDKEVESMRRAQDYVRAIQLYQRACKCTTYPASMDALEKSTKVRFLRRRWIDPLTGKSDWRLIHNPQTTVKGFFGQELQGLTAGLGSAASMASTTGGSTPGTSATTVSGSGLSAGFSGAQIGGSSGSTGSTGSTGSSSDTGMFGDSASGGIIKGVGTARTGESILTPNQQDTYETWEFWYDPRIELLKKNVNILGGGGGLSTGSSSSSGVTSTSLSGLNNLNNNSGSSGATGSTGSTGPQ